MPIVLDNLLITNYNKLIMNKNLLASVFLSLLLAVGVTNCKEAINATLNELGAVPIKIGANDVYWTSTEVGIYDAHTFSFYYGEISSYDTTKKGVYEDGAEWGSSYAIVFNGADAMTLTAQNGSDEIMSYVRQSIPMDIIEGSIIVRSTVAVDILPIL